MGISIQALTQEAAVAEVSRIEALVASRYDDYLLTLSDAQRSEEEAVAEAAGASGHQLFTEWSHRGVVRSLWSLRMRIPISSPTTATLQEKVSRFLDDHGAIFGLSRGGSELQVERTGPKEGGGTVVHLKETLMGLPVFGSGLVLHLGPEGDVEWIAGLVLPEYEVASASAKPTLTADMAAAAAGGTPLGSELGWFDPEAFGAAMGTACLAWRVRSAVGQGGYDVYVDAGTGSELTRVSLIYQDTDEHKEIFNCDGCGMLALPGLMQFDDYCHLSGDAQCPSGWCHIEGGDEYCMTPSWQGTSYDIYQNTKIVYDYYLDRHGRDGWDNGWCGHGHPRCTDYSLHRMRASSDINSFGECNAGWLPLDWYDPAQTFFSNKRYCLDQVGHEFTHGVNEIEANLSYADCTQSKTMSEAFSDVFGEFVERYHTGTVADWICGTGCDDCPSARNSNMTDPSLFSLNCDDPEFPACGGPGTSLPQPDHWSNYRKECNGHWNSTIISKAGYLMGREISEGFKTHWGFSVRGIGEVAAGKVWYFVLKYYLYGNATFTEFRHAIYNSCQYYCTTLSMCNYSHCINSVDAVGFWSSDAGESWNIDGTVDMAKFAVSGQTRWYIFYKDLVSNLMRYRYRTCPLTGDCSWTSPMTFDSGSSGPSAAVLPGSYMVVCFQDEAAESFLYCDTWDSSGNKTIGPDILQSIKGPPSLVYFDGTLYIAYIKSNNWIYWRKYNTATHVWGSENSAGFQSTLPPVLASSSEDYLVPSDNYLWIVYRRSSDNRLAYRRFIPSYSIWGSELVAGQSGNQFPIPQSTPGASFYRGRLHIASLDDTNDIWYASCSMPCNYPGYWSRCVEQDPSAQGDLVLDNYGASDGNLWLWHRLASDNHLNRRYKKSM